MAAPEMYRPACEALRTESGLPACVDAAYLLGRPVRESTSLERQNRSARDAVLAAATAKLTMAERVRMESPLENAKQFGRKNGDEPVHSLTKEDNEFLKGKGVHEIVGGVLWTYSARTGLWGYMRDDKGKLVDVINFTTVPITDSIEKYVTTPIKISSPELTAMAAPEMYRPARDAVLAAATARLTVAEPSQLDSDLADQDEALLAKLEEDPSVVDVCKKILSGQLSATNPAGTIVAHRLSFDGTTSTRIVTNSRIFCALWRNFSEIPCEFYALLGHPTNFNVF